MRLEICPTPSPLRITLGDPEPSRTSPGTSCRTVQLAPGAEGITQAAELLTAHTGRNAWWGGCEFSNGYRRAADLVTASAIVLDFDTVAGPKKRGEKKGRPRLDPATADVATMAAQLGELPGHLFHTSPRGVRLVAFLPHAVADFELFESVARGFAAEAVEAFDRLGLLAGPGDEGRTDRLEVDRSTFSAARAFYTPRAEVEDKETHEFQQRTADVVVMRTDALDLERLADSAGTFSTPTARTVRTRPASPRRDLVAGAGTDERSRAAVDAYSAAHPLDFSLKTCPTCGHNDCFGPLDGNPDRWACFSANHQRDSGFCGHEMPTHPGTGWGDALTIDAHLRNVRPFQLLRLEGYLTHDARAKVAEVDQTASTFEEAHLAVVDAVADGIARGVSRAVVAGPGAGKTTGTIRTLVQQVSKGGVAVLALRTRTDVAEKIADARKALAEIFGEQLVYPVDVLPLKGASGRVESGSYCSRFKERAKAADLLRYGCTGCPDSRECRSKTGRHIAHVRAVEEAADGANTRGVLIVATIDALQSRTHILPDDALIVLDDAGWDHGLREERTLDVGLLDDALDGLMDTDSDARLVADAVGKWAAQGGTGAKLDALLDELPQRVRDRLMDPEHAKPFDIEDDGEGLAWAPTALRIASAHLRGFRSSSWLGHGRTTIWSVSAGLAKRASAGRVLWLSVGSLPSLYSGLGAESFQVDIAPKNLTTLCAGDQNFGPGRRGSEASSRTDEKIRTLIGDLKAKAADHGSIEWSGIRFGPRIGAVLRKKTAKGLPTAGLKVETYGAGHAAHNRLEDRDVLVVARFALPPHELKRRAEWLGDALGLDVDTARAELEAFERMHNIGNAIGRLRPLTADRPQLVVLLDSVPAVNPHNITQRVTLSELVAGLGLPDREIYKNAQAVALERHNAQQVAKAEERADKVRDLVVADPTLTDQQVADRLGLSRPTVAKARGGQECRPMHENLYRDGSALLSALPTSGDVAKRFAVSWGLSEDSARRAARRYLARIQGAFLVDPDDPAALGSLTGTAGRRTLDVLAYLAELAEERAQLEQLVADIESAADAVSATDREPIARILRMAEAGRYGAGAEVARAETLLAQAVDALRILRGAG